jgi:phosphatidate phosphatase APP1
MKKKEVFIKVYHGFGHAHNMVVFGHVFKKKERKSTAYSTNPLINAFHMLRLFFVKPLSGIAVQMNWYGTKLNTQTEYDGFFRFQWASHIATNAGWHPVSVICPGSTESTSVNGAGEIFIPHITQYGFISDIDDTIMVSHSKGGWKRLKEILFRNPQSRTLFKNVSEHYRLLAHAHTTPDASNPFFYISSSEWNLYDYLRDIFLHNKLPDGAFLLNQVKKWYQIFQTGRTKHEGKILRIVRVLDAFPNQRFVLFGDNSQKDPEIYELLSQKYATQIYAVYIRNVHAAHAKVAIDKLKLMESRGLHVCFFKESEEAMQHSRTIGLLN